MNGYMTGENIKNMKPDIRRCTRCIMPDTRPGIRFNSDGVCYPCFNMEKRKDIDWEHRQIKLHHICDKYRKKNGFPDCVIPSSGGKDSIFQTYIMKELYDMNPILIKVCDSFTETSAGKHNLWVNSEKFECDIIRYNLNHSTLRRMVRLAFEHLGSPTWALDMAIYSIPLKIADMLNIPLVVYGENIIP